jgi:hypothetical protein
MDEHGISYSVIVEEEGEVMYQRVKDKEEVASIYTW